MRTFNITDTDKTIKDTVQNKIDNLNKPKGSLGELENLAMQICLIQNTLQPRLNSPCHILFGGDHGIEREGVSVSPRDVTWQQMINFSHGGGGVNMFCRQHGFSLLLVDVGVDHDLSSVKGLINRKVANGTKNFLHEAAMSNDEFNKAIAVGEEMTDKCGESGCNIICLGEMGIGNTSASSLWMSIFGNIPLKDCVGMGAGLNTDGVKRKYQILNSALNNFTENGNNIADTELIIRYFGGFEMVAAIGAMLRAAEKKMTIMVDGFIMTACALAASKLYPDIVEYMVFGHQGDESGHKRMLNLLNARPLLNLGLRLGEGTGALCAYPIIESAVRMINEMNNFENANITKYF